nr:MAG: nonstructural protein [Microvirus sp.]
MLLQFAIYDSKAEAFIEPFYQPTAGVASRMFAGAANDPRTTICKNSSDYTLFELGTFEPATGESIPHEAFINHGLASIHQKGGSNITYLRVADSPEDSHYVAANHNLQEVNSNE